jgi:hypothetical protein
VLIEREHLSLRDEADEFVKFDGQNDCKAEIENEFVRVFGKVHGSPFKKLNGEAKTIIMELNHRASECS